MSGDVLLVFVKEPRPGAVKTRLIPALGADLAAGLYRALAEAEVAATAPAATEYRRVLFYAPSGARAAMEAWFPGQDLRPQEGEELGARMARAFDIAFAEGARRVAIIGTDVPWTTRARVLEAIAALDGADVVVGPALDGGYYLLASRRPHPELFTGIAWSTPSVLTATAERARVLGLAMHVLPPLPDVDDFEDLRRHWGRLAPLLEGGLRARLEAVLYPRVEE